MAISLLPFLIVLSSAAVSFGTSDTLDLTLPPTLTESQVATHFKAWANKGTARAFLKAHNELRANFGVKPLRWDRSLARTARHWAYKMHNACSLTHSQSHYGENLFVGQGKWTIKEAVDEWAKEKNNYHWKDNSCNANKMCGHFTQMIWAQTEAVGCAKIHCNATFIFITCDYYPGGNIHGHWPVKNHQKFVH
ncbi:pathogenesis-related protein 1C-like protein [Carex littledalei]|uniref:Pathogenesis-related protein 1C-like protein n=1 Tax=Carex littledalei TaxID=544730 RepID=A0A833REE3_9POAL|nr:pathogenesis-related protein 1C-like protein [Carex littledalei]